MAAVLSISTAFATTVYCKVTQSWWTKDGAAVGVYYWGGVSAGTTWPGVRMTPVSGEEGTWTYDVPEDVTGLIFTRVNGSGDIADWGAKTTDLSLPTDGKNLYTITSESAVWGNPGVTGEWSTYGGDPSGAIKLTFTYYDKTDGDGSAKLSTVAAIFDAACQKYVDAVLVGTQVYAGRKYKEGNDSIFSNLKLGSSSAAGELKFDLANPTEVDSIVFRAAMYASNEGGEGFKVNGENFTLSAGKLIFEDKVWKPTGEVSTIDIVQNKASKGRFFLTSITIYPKASTPVPPVAAKFYVTGDSALVTDAGFAGKAWNPDAIKAEADTLVLNLKAEQVYKLKVSLDGTWNDGKVKGFNDLTEKPEGVTMDNDENIIFSLAEAGAVKVIYIAGESPIFKIAGNFYVDPTPVVPTAAVTGDMTEWGEPIPFELSEDSTYATLYNDNIKKGTYAFKMIINGAWRSNGYEFHRGFPGCAGITGNTDANMTVVIDVEDAYTFKWYFANDSLAIIYPEKPEPVLADGFYLVGKFSGVDAWSVEDLSAEKLFAANPDTEGEYQLSIDLAVDDEIKVVYVAEDEITTWYPKEGNYIVDDHHNGPTTMYFRPEYNSDWNAFGGYFYLVPTSTVGFENTAADAKAVKVLKNGILVIEKNNKTYNVMGQMVK